jgi:maltose phosphorylase
MNNYYINDEWLIIEEGFHPEVNRESESIFSIGNGYMGQRANFEEQYSGEAWRAAMWQESIIPTKPG